MTQLGIDLLKLMFNEDETICISHNEYGYHSIPVTEAMLNKVITLVPTPDSCVKRNIEWKEENFDKVHTDDLILVALNPMLGFREDRNCYKFRNFMIEVDTGELKNQLEYIKKLGLPYSACIFSGNKSLHFVVSLEKDLPDEKTWRKIQQWLLNIITLSDPNIQNPSRSLRIPGAYRDGTKLQRLVEMNGKVSLEELRAFLSKYPNAKPREREKRPISDKLDISRIKTPWVANALINGLDPAKGRNKQWFAIACEFALANYSEDDTIEILGNFFVEEHNFKEKEWLIAIRSGFKYIKANR